MHPLLRYATYQPILIVTLAAAFYLYEFFLRVSPSVLTHELMHFYQVGAGTLGSIMGCFFLAYTFMQIPSGLLGDHFGPRKMLTLAAVLCAISTLLFTQSDHVAMGMLTRFLLGLSASFAYIAPLMLAARWFSARYFAMLTGLIQMMGCMGAIVGGTPVVQLTHHYGWQSTLSGAAIIGAGLSLLFWWVIRDAPPQTDCIEIQAITQGESIPVLKRLSAVCHHPQTWAIALVGFACWAPIAMFAELWGVPFLERAYQLSTYEAAHLIRYTWIGIALGGPLMGYLSQYLSSRKQPLCLALIVSLITTYCIIYAQPQISWLPLNLFLFGLGASAQCVTFGCVRDVHPLNVSGTAVGFNNMAVIMGGVFCQPLVGLLLEHNWTGEWIDQVHAFNIKAYQTAFLLMPACTFVGLCTILFLLKESYCHPHD
ncbi:MAG: MFS transporter [Legionellales bacterium]|nr:MFS transporter [Legionellales bacterium]